MEKIQTSDLFCKLYDLLKEYDNKNCNLMIAGGSLLNIMDNEKIKNLKTDSWKIFYADERITENLEDLNFVQSEVFLKHLSPNSQVNSLVDANENFINNYDDKLSNLKKFVKIENSDIRNIVLPKMDLVFLGLGPDGHMCSLFPNKKIKNENQDLILISDSPKPPARRITVSLDYLNKQNCLCFFVKKRDLKEYYTQPHEYLMEELTTKVVVYYN